MPTKICTKCKQEKELSAFNRNKYAKSGLSYTCAECDREYNRIYHFLNREKEKLYSIEYVKTHKEKKKQYSIKNKEKADGYKRKYVETHPEKRKESLRKYYYKNREKIKQYARNNKEKSNLKRRLYNSTHPQTRIAHNLRSRICNVLSGRSKGGRLFLLIGCDMDFLKRYFESMFDDLMTWENYGKGIDKWSIDHIKPLETFNLEDESQQRTAFHWSNMKPMWYSENASKGCLYNGTRNHKKT